MILHFCKMLLLLFVMACAFSSCDNELTTTTLPDHFTINEPFELAFNGSALESSEAIQVSYVQLLNDSRCPTNVRCFWAGEVAVAVSLRLPDTEINGLELSLGTDDSTAHTAEVEGYRITLQDVTPYPELNAVNQEDTQAHLLVERL